MIDQVLFHPLVKGDIGQPALQLNKILALAGENLNLSTDLRQVTNGGDFLFGANNVY